MTVRIRSALDTLPAYAPGRSVPGAVKLASNELPFPALPVVAQAVAEAVGTEHAGRDQPLPRRRHHRAGRRSGPPRGHHR